VTHFGFMFKGKRSGSGKADGGGASLDFLKNKDMAEWSVVEVGLWLNSIHMSQYSDAFFFNEIDGEMLGDLDEDDLIAMPIERMGHRKKILRRIQKLKKEGASSIIATSVVAETTQPQRDDVSSESDSSQTNQSIAPAGSQKLRVKCAFGGEIRTISLTYDEVIQTFLTKVTKEFGANHSAKYRDEDGDMVTIRNAHDLQSFLRLAKTGNVKLTIYSTRSKKERKKKSSTSASSTSSVSKKKEKDGSDHEDFNLLENFNDGVVVTDRRGTVLFFNGAAEDLFGYDREEVIGNNVRMLMNDEDAAKHNQYLRRYRREGSSRIIGKGRRVVAKNREGKRFDVWLSLSETDTCFTGIIQEIHGGERKLLQAAKVKDLSVEFKNFESYPDPVAVVNETGFIQYANAACYATFLHDPHTLLGQKIAIICPAISSDVGEDLLSDYVVTISGKKGSLLTNNARDVICYTKKSTLIARIADFSHRVIDDSTFFVIQFKSQDRQREAVSVLQTQRAVLSSLIVPALIIDQNAIVQEMNSAARDLFGYSLSEVLGQNVNMLIPPGDLFNNHTSYVSSFAKTGVGRGQNGTSNVVGKGREVIGVSKGGLLLNLLLSVTVSTEKNGEKIFTGILQFLGQAGKSVVKSVVLQQQIEVIDQLIIPACVITQVFDTFCKVFLLFFQVFLNIFVGFDCPCL
jgi:PAS domain S-box-containing protein